MLLPSKSDFQVHYKSLLKKVNKTIALLHIFQNIIPRPALLPIYICFVRTYLDYGNMIYSCPKYLDEKLTLLKKIRNINSNILENINSQIAHFFSIRR